jgi:hypothetical protein
LFLEFSKWPPIKELKKSLKIQNEQISMEMDIYRE